MPASSSVDIIFLHSSTNSVLALLQQLSILCCSFTAMFCSTPTQWSNFDCQVNYQKDLDSEQQKIFNGSQFVQFFHVNSQHWRLKISIFYDQIPFGSLDSEFESNSSNYSFFRDECVMNFFPSQPSDHLRASTLRIIIKWRKWRPIQGGGSWTCW